MCPSSIFVLPRWLTSLFYNAGAAAHQQTTCCLSASSIQSVLYVYSYTTPIASGMVAVRLVLSKKSADFPQGNILYMVVHAYVCFSLREKFARVSTCTGEQLCIWSEHVFWGGFLFHLLAYRDALKKPLHI